jgi:hypothetical protein
VCNNFLSDAEVAQYEAADCEIGGCCPATAAQLGWSREDGARYRPSTSPVRQPASSNCIIAPSLIKLWSDLMGEAIDERASPFDGPKRRIRALPCVVESVQVP